MQTSIRWRRIILEKKETLLTSMHLLEMNLEFLPDRFSLYFFSFAGVHHLSGEECTVIFLIIFPSCSMLSNRPIIPYMFPHIFPHSQLPRVIINVEVRKKQAFIYLFGNFFCSRIFFLSRSAVWVVSASNVLLWQEGKRSSVPNGEPFFLSGKGPFSHTSSLCNFFWGGEVSKCLHASFV